MSINDAIMVTNVEGNDIAIVTWVFYAQTLLPECEAWADPDLYRNDI